MVKDLLLVVLAGAGVYFYMEWRNEKEKAKKVVEVAVESPTVTPEAAAKLPEGWTATVKQLEQLLDLGYTTEDPTYKKAVDLAYEAVKSELKTGEVVAWSSEKGYYAIPYSETYGR